MCAYVRFNGVHEKSLQDSSHAIAAQNDAYLGMDVGFVRECYLVRATIGRPYGKHPYEKEPKGHFFNACEGEIPLHF